MKRIRVVLAAVMLVFVLAAGARAAQEERSRVLFEEALGSTPLLRGLVAEPERYRLQIVFAEVAPRAGGGEPAPRWRAYRENAEYFYPASTVKPPAAAAALVRLQELQRDDPDAGLDAWTPWSFEPLFGGESAESVDAERGGEPLSLAYDARLALIPSDNPAFNRLYEFVGQDRLNRILRSAGLRSMRIVHRLAEGRSAEENLLSPAIAFGGGTGVALEPRRSEPVREPAVWKSLPGRPDVPIGRAYMVGGERVAGPMLFGGKNFVTLRDLAALAVMIARPDVDLGLPGPGLTEGHRELLLSAMSDCPSESERPVFDAGRVPDEWPHFFLGGLERVKPRGELVIANKVGLAYGFLTEVAYVEHAPTGRAFVLAMTVYANDNATLNDNDYGYEWAEAAMRDVAAFFARRVFEGEAAEPMGEGVVRAPVRWEHDRRTFVEPGEPMVAPAGEAVELGVWELSDPAEELVASWNVSFGGDGGEERGGVRLEASVSDGAGGWSAWLPIAEAGPEPPDDAWPVRDGSAGVRTAVDVLLAPEGFTRVRLRVRAAPGADATVRRLDAVVTGWSAEDRWVRDERRAGRVERATPYVENTVEDETLRSRICSPLSLGMLLGSAGVEPGLDAVLGRAHDERFSIYGNWTLNIQAAYELGAAGWLTRFSDWSAVRRHLEEVGPIAVSARFAEGEITNAPYGTESGHLFVIYGLDERGDALVLDPALSPESEARRVYARDELSEVWMNRAKGLAYAVVGPGGLDEGVAR